MRNLYSSLTIAFVMLIGLAAHAQQPCGFWYVSPSGSGTVGTPDQPVSLDYALANVDPSRNYIRMLGGNYPTPNKISMIDDVVIEGGYQISGADWVLNTNAPTNINITSSLETAQVGGVTVGHHIGIEAVNVSNFVLRNLTVNVQMAGATGTTDSRGNSIYGVYLNNATGFELTMVKVNTGAASKGADGENSTGFVGANSTGGTGGTGRGGCSTGSAGNSGAGGGGAAVPYGTSVPAASGGSAGAGGAQTAGPGCNFLNCNGSNRNGNPGATGGAGGNGHSWTPNDPSPTPVPADPFFVPADRQDGGDGAVGGGGGGGGGSTAGTCVCVSCAGRDGAQGGQGGRGGRGGRGGFGGGGSFAVYSVNSSGSISHSDLTPGSGGATSAGGSGVSGELGSVGGTAGCNGCVCANRCGGAGGDGGVGGTGGRGRDGASGASIGLVQTAGSVVQVQGAGVPTDNGPVTVNQFSGCTNSEITVAKGGGTFDLSAMGGAQLVDDLGPGSSSYTPASSTAGIFYSATGQHDVVVSGTSFNDIINITGTRPLPSFEVLSQGVPVTALCGNTTATFQTADVAAQYEWAIISNGAASPPSGGAANDITTHVFPAEGSYLVRLRVKDECCGWSIPVFQEVNVGAGPTISLGNDTSICFPGSITLDPGVGFNSYAWAPGGQDTQTITASSPGTYTVTVTDDSGCPGVASVQVQGNPAVEPFVLPSGPTSFCPGGSVTLTANDGFQSYTWNDGVTQGSAITVSESGTYFVAVVDGSGCTGASVPVNVTVFTPPSANIVPSGTVVICEDESLTITAPAGFDSYQWSNGQTGPSIIVNETGEYSAVITDINGCVTNSLVADVTVHIPVVPTIVANGPVQFCNGGNVILSIEENYASYLWNSGSTTSQAVITQSGSYYITVMDQFGCIDSSLQSAPVDVTVWAPQPEMSIVGSTIIVTDSTNYSGFQWYLNGNVIPGANGPTYAINPTGSGNYEVEVTDANGCTGRSLRFEMTCCVGITDPDFEGEVNVYPNPTNGEFIVELDFVTGKQVTVELMDITGRSLWVDGIGVVETMRHQYDLSEQANGVYFLRVTADGSMAFVKLIKR